MDARLLERTGPGNGALSSAFPIVGAVRSPPPTEAPPPASARPPSVAVQMGRRSWDGGVGAELFRGSRDGGDGGLLLVVATLRWGDDGGGWCFLAGISPRQLRHVWLRCPGREQRLRGTQVAGLFAKKVDLKKGEEKERL
jgi:hypothetical protein